MKKIISLFLCITLISSLLVGCGSIDSENGDTTNATTGSDQSETKTNMSDQEPVEIRIGFWPAEDRENELVEFEEYKKICEEKYPYITVIPDYYKYDESTFLPMALAGETPTVFSTWFTEPKKLIEGGYVADITEIIQETGYDKKINPGFLEITSKEGRLYGLPYSGYGLGLLMNMNLFREAGLVDLEGMPLYPKTYDELVKTAEIITEKTGKAGMYIATNSNVGGWHFTNLAWNFGAEFEVLEDGKWMSNIDSPEVIEALKFIRSLKYDSNVLLPDALLAWGEWVQNYGTDNVGMVLAAVDAINNPVQQYSMNKDAIAIAPMPEGPGGQYALTGGNIYMFSADATPEQIDACLKFMEITGFSPNISEELKTSWDNTYSTKAENGEVVGPTSIPVWIDEDRVKAENEIIEKYTNVDMKLFNDYFDMTPNILKPEEPVFTQELYATLDDVIQATLASPDSDIEGIVKAADEKFQKDYLDTLN